MGQKGCGSSGGDGSTPSSAAADRLRAALSAQVAAYTAELDVDLDDVDRATATDRVELAAAVVAQHVDRLAAFREDVEHLLAEAVVEREAESVVAAASERLSAPEVPCAAPPSPTPGRHAGRLGVAVLASLLALLTVTGAPLVPDHETAATAHRADGVDVDRQHQEDSGDADGPAEPAALDPRRRDSVSGPGVPDDDAAGRQRLSALMAGRQDTLLQLAIGGSSGTALLERIRELTRDLPKPPLRGLADGNLRQGRERSADDRAQPSEQPQSEAPAQQPPAPQEHERTADPHPPPPAEPSGQDDEPAPEAASPPADEAEPDARGSRPPAEDDGEESLPGLIEEGSSLGAGPAELGQG